MLEIMKESGDQVEKQTRPRKRKALAEEESSAGQETGGGSEVKKARMSEEKSPDESTEKTVFPLEMKILVIEALQTDGIENIKPVAAEFNVKVGLVNKWWSNREKLLARKEKMDLLNNLKQKKEALLTTESTAETNIKAEATEEVSKELVVQEAEEVEFKDMEGTVKKKNKSGRGSRAKGKACKDCAGCRAADCNKCKHCLDKPRNGGANNLKKKCLERTCEQELKLDDVNKEISKLKRKLAQKKLEEQNKTDLQICPPNSEDTLDEKILEENLDETDIEMIQYDEDKEQEKIDSYPNTTVNDRENSVNDLSVEQILEKVPEKIEDFEDQNLREFSGTEVLEATERSGATPRIDESLRSKGLRQPEQKVGVASAVVSDKALKNGKLAGERTRKNRRKQEKRDEEQNDAKDNQVERTAADEKIQAVKNITSAEKTAVVQTAGQGSGAGVDPAGQGQEDSLSKLTQFVNNHAVARQNSAPVQQERRESCSAPQQRTRCYLVLLLSDYIAHCGVQ